MAQEVTCPECGKGLLVADATGVGGLSCPRCLAPLASAAITTSPAPLPSSGSQPRYPEVDVRLHSPDSDVRVNQRMVYFGALILTALAIVGTFTWLHSSRGRGSSAEGATILGMLLLLPLFAVLDALVLLPVGMWTVRLGMRPGLTTGSLVLRVLGGVVVFFLLAIAVFIFFYAVCYAGFLVAADIALGIAP